MLGLLGSLEINVTPIGIDSTQDSLWSSVNLRLLIGANCLMSTLFDYDDLSLIRPFEE